MQTWLQKSLKVQARPGNDAMIVIFRLLAWSEAVKCWQGTNCPMEYELEPSKVRREEEDAEEEEDEEEEERENNKS